MGFSRNNDDDEIKEKVRYFLASYGVYDGDQAVGLRAAPDERPALLP